MKKNTLFMIFFTLSVLFSARWGSALNAEAMEVRRFGLFIGANNGGDERQTLLYADDDARDMMLTMEQIGGIDPSDSLLLLNPTAGKIREALKIISLQIEDVNPLVRRTEIMFYYSGHSNGQGLLLADEDLSYKDIRDSLDTTGADVVIAVLDSCSSGAFTRAKGGERRSPFLIDESSSMEGHAFLTSSSESELSQESDLIEGSFFTHYLISGLRGAADNTGDGRVSLNEIYEHTFRETLSSTESTIGGPQHATYEIQLTGTGDLVLTDLTIPTSALLISGELAGRFSVRSGDKLIAEFSKYREDTFKMALPAGEYTINMADGDDVRYADIELSRNGQFFLTEKDFSSRRLVWTRFRGERNSDEEVEIPFTLSLFPGINYPTLPDNSVVMLQAGLSAYAPRFEGVQASYLFNITQDDSEGVQVSQNFNIARSNFQGIQGAGIFNIAGGNLQGVQGAGLFNIAGDELSGLQAAGLFNMAGRPSSGVQLSGLFNIAGELEGFQAAGLFNSTDYLDGMQISLVNKAGTVDGFQLGLVNIAREMDGLAVGLINISRNGIVDLGAWYDSGDGKMYTFFQSGSPYFYTLYFIGNEFPDHSERETVWGAHAGCRLGLGPLEIDLDGGFRSAWQDVMDSGADTPYLLPSGRAVIAFKGLGLFCGFSAVMSFPGSYESTLYDGDSFALFGNEDYHIYPDFIIGLRI